MKAAIYTHYGPPDVVKVGEVPKPQVNDHEVLVRIYATTVTTGDWRARSLDLPPGFALFGRPVFGFFGPRQQILGTELAGEVEAIGQAVTRFKVGDHVFAFTGAKYGCHAEYRTLAETGMIAHKPTNLSFEEAAALSFGGTTALTFLHTKGKIKAGDSVLIVGASGGVGSAAVAIAKHFGATVTAVCSSRNIELVGAIGADKVIDYTAEDFTKRAETYDLIFDTTGTCPLSRCEHVLKPGGRLLIVLGSFAQVLGLQRVARGSGKKVIAQPVSPRLEDLQFLAKLAECGAFKPVIDCTYTLENIAQAHAHVDGGHKRGNVVVTMKPSTPVALS